MKLEHWETTADLNDIYADVRANDLEQCVAELDAFGFTVLPPEKVAPPEFHARLRQAILDVHERRTGHRIDPDRLATGSLEGDRPLATHWSLLGEDTAFEQAVMNPIVYTMARYLCGRSVLLSDAVALIKRSDPTPTHMLHIDQAGTPPPLPPYQQVINITWALTDYTRDNGALAMVPGSHRFGRMPLPYEENFLSNDAPVRAVPVECPAGSLIIWGGTTWHGSYPRNQDGLRVNLIMAFCRSYMKQVRDFRREIPEPVVQRNGPEFAQLIGMNSLYPIDAKTGTDPEKVKAFTGAGRNPWA
ncbi:MAG TPA: phytanoyl-CoA dioxygenase family protein [Caulobacteraceae bacterium]|jgi:ectoine hydroxylase-related dioxygenase (phytanoyl-CoA dioxygenase family)|nr:phytanoyl-CoA dioxygenase family protein [Caulobacteraceae bacterium]